MRALPLDIGPIHFVGIGGIGMSGIAEVLLNLGYKVQGSDVADGANTERLRERGIKVFIGQSAENLGARAGRRHLLGDQDGNPEVAAARARNLPVVRRAEMLAELMRLKWTSRSPARTARRRRPRWSRRCSTRRHGPDRDQRRHHQRLRLERAHRRRRVDGGRGRRERRHASPRLPATVAVVTNIDPEHLDHYGTFDAMRDGLRQLRLEHPVLRLRRAVHRPSRGAGAGRAASPTAGS